MTEEERAAMFRQQCANRQAWYAARAQQLAGDPAARAALAVAWSPLLPQSTDSWDCLPRMRPGRPPWEGNVPGDIELPEYLKRQGT